MRTGKTFLALGLLATAASAGTTHVGITHVVVGRSDIGVDRPAIQAAIDGAAPSDTIELQGSFLLDGTSIFVETSELEIVGLALDNDGDGSVNEDWADGIDNDGDGQTDEDDWDATLTGIDDGFGGPAVDVFPNRFNDAFEMVGFNRVLKRLEFRDMKFDRVNRAIYFLPDYDDSGTVLVCDSSSPTRGSVDRPTISGNLFENTFRGVELLGRVDRLTARENRFVGTLAQSVLLFGQEVGCAEADGSIVESLPFGTPRRTLVVDNDVEGAGVGVLSFISDRTTVRDNRMSFPNFGVLSVEDSRMAAFGNTISGAIAGVFGTFLDGVTGPSSRNTFAFNLLEDNLFGAIVDCESTGYLIAENEFSGSFLVDVLLDGNSPGGECGGLGDSFENIVIATQFPTLVQDFGIDNLLLGDEILTGPIAISAADFKVLSSVRP